MLASVVTWANDTLSNGREGTEIMITCVPTDLHYRQLMIYTTVSDGMAAKQREPFT